MMTDFCKAFSSLTCECTRIWSYQTLERGFIRYASTNLLLELPVDGQVDGERVLLGRDAHGGVGNGTDSPGQVGDGLGGHLPLLGDTGGEFASVVLDVLNVSLDLGSELLEVLNDRRVDGSGEGRVGLGDDAGLVTDGVEDVLQLDRKDGLLVSAAGKACGEMSETRHAYLNTTFTQELVSMPERDLDDGSQLGQLLGGVGLDVGDTLKVGCFAKVDMSIHMSQSGNRAGSPIWAGSRPVG
jgi:hypothetical protein